MTSLAMFGGGSSVLSFWKKLGISRSLSSFSTRRCLEACKFATLLCGWLDEADSSDVMDGALKSRGDE